MSIDTDSKPDIESYIVTKNMPKDNKTEDDKTEIDSHFKDIENVSLMRIAIPRKMMITWKSTDPEDIPDEWREGYDSIFIHMPHWEVIFMDDNDNRQLIETYFPDYLSTYDSFPYHIQRVDAVRYAWLYINGGLYKDMDLTILKPLDPLFQSDSELFLISSGNISGYLTNSMMASKPRCPIWLKMMEHTTLPPPTYAITKHWIVMTTTGPIGLNSVVKNSDTPYMSLPSKLCMPCSTCNLDTCDTSQAWIKPSKGSSWVSIDSQVYNTVMCNWQWFIAILVLAMVIIIGWFLLRCTGIFH